MFAAHVAALAALVEGKPGEAYPHVVASVQPFVKVGHTILLAPWTAKNNVRSV
jgi:hypothetical protein